MSVFRFRHLSIEDHFDVDDELKIETEGEYNHYEWLPRDEVVRLRDHLNTVLGVAND